MSGRDEPLTREVQTLSSAGAKLALDAAEQTAVARGVALSIAIVDHAGHLLAFTRMDGAPLTSIEAAVRKARTAAQLGLPTNLLEDLLHGGNTSLLAFEFVTPSQGGVPVKLGAAVVGAVGVSGGSGEDDVAAAQAGADIVANMGG